MASKTETKANKASDEQGRLEAHLPWRFIVPIASVGLVVAVVLGFELIYAGRVLPGVTADGVKVGGMTRTEAIAAINRGSQQYHSASLVLRYNATAVAVPVASLSLNYNSVQSAQLALNFGRTGGILSQLHGVVRSLFGRSTAVSQYSYSDAQLAGYVGTAVNAVDSAVANASLGVAGNQITVVPAQQGGRLDIGLFTDQINDRLAGMSTASVTATPYDLAPAVDTAGLTAAKDQASVYLAAPLTLSYAGRTTTVPVSTIATWLTVSSQPPKTSDLPSYIALPPHVTVGLSQAPIAAYVSNLAAAVDTTPVNATITLTNGQPTAASTGSNGQSLDEAGSVAAIVAALAKPAADRTLALNVATVKPAVSSDSLAGLGISDLLSEGETTFFGSNADRNTNIRVGSSQFNDVLVAPGQVFSFDTGLGPIGPQYGYAPGYVILSNKEELQYGGGLCQVATTMYRAALLAGLPIDQRTNHSYAVSWYVAPYGVPGVDATIYPPDPDLKWTNDTGHYILMTTTMTSTSLKFDFYGTKTKYGQIRGPYFVSGSSDATQASHTVFYRDVLNLAGQVTSTDTINSYYEPSTDFPIVD
jgi:vancomycin resistance protein YoaR